MILATLVSATVIAAAPGPAVAAGATRRAGPAGSTLILESNRTVPLVRVIIASRSGSAADPRHREGLTNMAAEWARRGAGGRSREATDAAIDALGATLEVTTEPDSTRFEAEVLTRNLDPLLALLADVVVRPSFLPAEFARTRNEIEGQIDEDRKSTRLNSSHITISYAVFCLKKKK